MKGLGTPSFHWQASGCGRYSTADTGPLHEKATGGTTDLGRDPHRLSEPRGNSTPRHPPLPTSELEQLHLLARCPVVLWGGHSAHLAGSQLHLVGHARQVTQGVRLCGTSEGRGKCVLHLGDMNFRGARGETMVGRILRGPKILGPGVHTPLALLSHILL